MKSNHILGALFVITGCIGSAGHATETASDIMSQACKAYDGANTGRLKIYASIDDDILEDTKIQQNYVIDIQVKRPNKFKASTQGDQVAAVFFNGKMISAVDYTKNFFARHPFTGNLPELLVEAERMNLPTPMLDFFEREHCLANLKTATSGQILSDLMLNGEIVKHLVFKNEQDKIDWQVWIAQKDGRSMIKKALITSRYIPTQPQFQFTVVSEELNPRLDDDDFDFFAYDSLTLVPFLADLDQEMQPMYRRPVARGTARRTTRRVVRRNYIRRLPAGCVYNGGRYLCAGVYYRAVIEDGVTVYIVVNP